MALDRLEAQILGVFVQIVMRNWSIVKASMKHDSYVNDVLQTDRLVGLERMAALS